MKVLGYLLLVVGFLGGSFVASLDPEDVIWSAFVPALLIGAAGLWLVKRAEHAESRSEAVLKENQAHLGDSLTRVVAELRDLDRDKDDLGPEALLSEVDARFRADLHRFAEARETLAHLYGLQAYAEIMSAFATGERYLNRVWSASADGYVDEARTYVGKSLEQFEDALAHLEAVQASAVQASA
jgi:ElaB/YqjD/DUF883 family membrane-anchored ribosome-binding protein